jgi:hypothetical protein
MDRKIYQPIHPDIRHRLDPEYLDFHEKYLQYTPPSDSIPWDPASRFAPAPSSAGKSSPIEVGSIRDLDKGHYQLRVFMPKGAAPEKGWPVFVWYHGG